MRVTKIRARKPADLMRHRVVGVLAGMDAVDRARTLCEFRQRWPRAGIWRDLRLAVKAELERRKGPPPPSVCKVCGVEIPRRPGPGRPRVYCCECRP